MEVLEEMIRVAIQDFNNEDDMYAYVEDMYGQSGIAILENIIYGEGK